jgi:hypothetical protein
LDEKIITMLTDNERRDIELDGITRIATAGLNIGERKQAKYDTQQWLNSMSPEQLEAHYERERDLEKDKLNKGSY